MANVVGPKGQVVIAKEIRDRLGVEPGWLALQRIEGDHVEVFFVPPEHRKSLKGRLAKNIRKQIAPGEDWGKARDMSWEKSAHEKMSTQEKVS